MESRVTDMTSGKPSKLILKFALPLMLGGVFQHLYTVVDAAIVGQFCGVNSLAALGSTDSVSPARLRTIFNGSAA